MSVYHYYSDEELVSLLIEGNHLAFAEIYNRYWEVLADGAYQRLHSREDAEEVVQEVFVSLYVRRTEIELKSTLEAYLKTALKYRVIDAYRAQQSHYRYINTIMEENNFSIPAPDRNLEIKELNNSVLYIAGKLPEKCREVFVLSRFNQLSHQEIADQLGISVSTVKKHIHKALRFVRQNFKDTNLELLVVGMFIFLR